jgi:hypothetical protein
VSSVAIIACDHGLGHVRRCVLNAEALHRAGAEVTLMAPADAVARVHRSLELAPASHVRLVDFATETTLAGLRAGAPRTLRWHDRVPDLARFDHVVVDTLPEVIELRPDAVLVAQFLWHDVLDGIAQPMRARAADLVRRARLVIGSAPFAMPAVRALPGFVEVGLHLPDTVARDRVEPSAEGTGVDGQDLLVTGGTTDALRAPLAGLVAGLVRTGPGPFRAVHVDAELLPSDPPSWLRPAVHTPAMYDGLRVAVVRPGLGTVTELLARDVRILCVREPGNAELAHNAGVVVELGAGEDLGAPDGERSDQILAALLRTPVDGVMGRRAGVALRFDGASRTAELVLARSSEAD